MDEDNGETKVLRAYFWQQEYFVHLHVELDGKSICFEEFLNMFCLLALSEQPDVVSADPYPRTI